MDQNHNQNQHPPLIEQWKSSFGFFNQLANILAMPGHVFMHRFATIGERYVGTQAVLVIPLMLVYILFWPGYNLVPLMIFLCAYLIACVATRIVITVRRRRGGQQPHSYYTGLPVLMKYMPSLSEQTVKGGLEPLFLSVGGVLTLGLNQPLGWFLVLCGVGMFISVNLSLEAQRLRSLDLHDSTIESGHVTEAFRSMRGD